MQRTADYLDGRKVLITGGAGFVGSHLVDAYLKTGVGGVTVYDDFSTGSNRNLSHIKDPRLKVIRGDILNFDSLDKSIRKGGFDVVNHLAAELEVFTGIRNVNRDAEINIMGTLNVLRSCLENKVGKVLFASSACVYGQARRLPEDEGHPLFPHWPYGVSKLAAEKYCRQFHELNGMDTASFRYSIVYGPREWFGRALTMFIKRSVLERKPLIVFGDGKQQRDFVFVEDVVKAHIMASEPGKASGEEFNISTGRGTSINELARTVLDVSGAGVEIIHDNPKEGESSRYQPERVRLVGELKEMVMDPNKARKILGWKAETPLPEGIKKEIEWVTKSPSAWDVKPRV